MSSAVRGARRGSSGRRNEPPLSPYELDLVKGKVYLLIDASEVDPVFALVGVFSDIGRAITWTRTDPTTWHEVTDYWYEESDRWRLTPMVIDEQRRWARVEWEQQREAYIKMHRQTKFLSAERDDSLNERLFRYVDGRIGFEMLDLGISICNECGDTGWTRVRLPNRILWDRCPRCQGGVA